MNFINSLNDKYFTLNGVPYFKNYISAVHGNKVEIYNCYERKDVLVPLSPFSDFTVDGSVYTSAAQLQAALLELTYSRLTTSDSSSIDQNNIGRVIAVGNIGPAGNVFFNAAYAVANKLNTMEIIITAKQTPVIITASLLVAAETHNYVSKRYKYLFKPGKGNWGLNGTSISWLQLELINIENYLVDHLLSEPNAIINNLGELPDGNFLTAANANSWDFSDAGTEGETGIKTYYFSYETESVLYFIQFVGVPGTYGSSYTAQFTAADFVSTTDSRITDIPTLEEVLAQGGNINVVKKTGETIQSIDGTIIINGHLSAHDGIDTGYISITSPPSNIHSGTNKAYVDGKINGLTITVNQAAAELYLKNNNNDVLATINLGFLNNEGTTFFFNVVTQKLELRNDAGTILSEVPVSAFVSNIMQSVDFNVASPQILEFKDAQGNIADSVTITINNIQGLQTALNAKANTDGSNASGNWGINISGTASRASKLVTSGGDSTFHWIDGINVGVPPTWIWGGVNATDIYVYSPLSFPISNATQVVLDSKVNLNGANATGNWPISISGTAETSTTATNWSRTYVSDFNVPVGFKLLESYVNPANSPGNGAWGQGIQFSTNNNPNYANQLIFDITGNLFTRTKYDSSWNNWSKIPLDENVLHKEGDEVKSGSLTINGNNKGYYLGNAGNNASILYNANGNLDITPRAGYNTVFTAGKVGLGMNPEYKLDVNGSIRADGVLNISQSAVFGGEVTIPNGTSGTSAINKSQLDTKANDADVVHKYGNETINGQKQLNGPVLINTSTNPNSASLKVNGAIEFDGNNFNLTSFKVNDALIGSLGQGDYTMAGGNPSAFGISSIGDLQFGAGNLPKAMLKANGFMGIGTINPAHKFVVSREGFEGFEVAVPGYPDGGIYLQNYDRTSSDFKPMYFNASAFIFNQELIIPEGNSSGSAINKTQLYNSSNSILASVENNYIPKIGEVIKSGKMTFIDSPIIPDATDQYHPITRNQLNNTRFKDFITIKGIDYTVNTANDIGQTGVITIYINAVSNNVNINLPDILQSSAYYTYNFKRIDNSSYTAKIISPMTIDGQTYISLGHLHSITIKSVIDKYWIFSKYIP